MTGEYLLGDELLDGVLRDVGVGGADHEGDGDLAGGFVLLPATRIHTHTHTHTQNEQFCCGVWWFRSRGYWSYGTTAASAMDGWATSRASSSAGGTCTGERIGTAGSYSSQKTGGETAKR